MSAELAVEGQNRGFGRRGYSERLLATHIHGDFLYEIMRVTRRNLWYLRHIAKPFEDQLGYDVFRSPDEVRHNIQPCGEVTMVRPRRGRDVGKNIGIATREMRRGVLVTGVVVINEEYQKRGIATHLAEDAIFRLKPIAVTGRSRIWRVPRTYEELQYQEERVIPVISPIDTGGKLSEEAQRQLTIVLTPKEREKLDLETGLYPDGTYPKIRDLRKFPVPRNNLAGMRIVNALREMGIDPANPEDLGKGFRYWGETSQDVLNKASAAYNPCRVVVIPAQSMRDRIIAAIFGLPIINFVQPALKKL